MSERDICDGMEQHEHGTRYVDDEGRCLACSVKARDTELTTLRERVRGLEAEVSMLRREVSREQSTLTQLRNFVEERETFLRNQRELDDKERALLSLPTTLEGAGGAVRAQSGSKGRAG